MLLVEDDDSLSWVLSRALSSAGHAVTTARTTREALSATAEAEPECALVDVHLPDADGIELVRELRGRYPNASLIVVTARDDASTLARALDAGANDYLVKPVDVAGVLQVVASVAESRRRMLELGEALRRGPHPLIGRHPGIEQARRDIALVAGRRDLCVLVHGETGTGKDVVARALHEVDGTEGALVDLNCSAIPEALFESELFGHEAGAFTSAKAAKKGLMDLADRGTLFLDEIGDLPPLLQPKLLRAVEERAFRRVGGTQSHAFDARIVSATHQPVTEDSAGRRLRADLYYRLAGHVIHLPPLRERGEDVLLLAEFFLARLATRQERIPSGLAPQTRRLLLDYAWPGNVRELKSVIERAALHATDDMIRAAHLPPALVRAAAAQSVPAAGTPASPEAFSPRPLRDVERDYLAQAHAHFDGNLLAMSRALKIARTTLRGKLRRFGLATEADEI